MLAARLLQIGIERADAKLSFFQSDEPLEVIVLRITCANACFMNGGGYCVLFCHCSPGTDCDGEKWHRIPLDCIKSSIGCRCRFRHPLGGFSASRRRSVP